jgi:hypothetical protein
MSHFSGINPMEKRKIQRDEKSGGEILTYMQKFEKMTFDQRTLEMTHLPKSHQTKEKCIVTSRKKLENGIK